MINNAVVVLYKAAFKLLINTCSEKKGEKGEKGEKIEKGEKGKKGRKRRKRRKS